MTEPPRGRQGALAARLAEAGSSAQAAIPGIYAWAVTVAPAAWSPTAPWLAKAAAILGVASLASAPIVENLGAPLKESAPGRWRSMPASSRARILAIWGFVLPSLLVWILAPSALAPAKFDVVRGVLGLLGWALFAFACAGPARRPLTDEEHRITLGATPSSRSPLSRGDGLYIGAGALVALAMQGIGWNVVVPERALLVRLVTVVTGIAVIGASASIALARHVPRPRASRSARFRRSALWLVLLLLLGVSGTVLLTTR